MCGLGFVGLLILLFYLFIVITLIIFAGQRLCMKILKKLRDGRPCRARGGIGTGEEAAGKKH